MERAAGIVIALIALMLASPAAAAPTLQPLKGVAFVIGETDYVRLPELANPDKDARDIDHMLDDLGFDVTRTLDASSADLRAKIDSFIAEAKSADVALVYYAGHGIEAGGKDYIMGTDADISDAASAQQTLISLDDTLDRLRQAVPVTILLLDACRTNPFTGQQTLDLNGNGPVAIGSAGLDALRGPTPVSVGKPNTRAGIVIGFSASPGESALDGSAGSNSPYAAALLQHLTANGSSFGDIMTYVTQEVYVDTGARQLPWTSSSLTQVLYFGRSAETDTGDDAQILGDRRKLLLQIAALPDQSKAYVETVATQEDLKLADLYSMLGIINASKGSTDDSSKSALLDVAKRVREVLDDPILSGAPTDPQLARLDALANKAIAAGAFQRAYGYRQQEATRAAQIEKGLDVQQAQIDATRQELAGVYARVAEAAMYNSDPAGEVRGYKQAAAQSDRFDPTLSLRLRLRAANVLADTASKNMDEHTGQQAIALYKDILKSVDFSGQPRLWAEIQLRMGWTMWDVANRFENAALHAETVSAAYAALRVFTPSTDPRNWTSSQRLLVEALRHDDQFGAAHDALTTLLASIDKSKYPLDWAYAQQSRGELSYWLGFGQSDVDTALLSDAVSAFGAAADASTRSEYWLHVLMLAKKAEVATYLAIRQGDRQGVRDSLQQGRAALALWNKPGTEQWGNQATYLGRNLIAAGLFLSDPTLLKEGLALQAKAEKIIRRDNNRADWSHMRQADGDALAWLGMQGARNPQELQAAVVAYDDAYEGIRDMGHWDYDGPRLKKIKIEQLLGQKLGASDAALANLPAPAAADFTAATLTIEHGGQDSQSEGYAVRIDDATVDGRRTSLHMSLLSDFNSRDRSPAETMFLRLAVPSSALADPESRSANYTHCGIWSAEGDEFDLAYGKESFLNACVLSKMAPADAATWEAVAAALPGLVHAAASKDATAMRVDQLFAAKPSDVIAAQD